MAELLTLDRRHPHVEHRRLPLDEKAQDLQFQRGLWTLDRGVKYPLPIDHIRRKSEWQGRDLWVRGVMPQGKSADPHVLAKTLTAVFGDIPELGRIIEEEHQKETEATGQVVTYRKGAVASSGATKLHYRVLARLRDEVDATIPEQYYFATLGHDLHVSTYAELYANHWHAGWADPITGEVTPAIDPWFTTLFATHWVDHVCDMDPCPRNSGITIQMLQSLGGFVECLGLLCGAKVTDAFVSEEIDELVSATSSEYADFDFHEVGTSSQAEDNNDTALIATSGIARATGSPTDATPVYQSVATTTADASETWEEMGLFNNSTGAALLDRSLTGGQSVNSSDQVQYTHQTTKNPEA